MTRGVSRPVFPTPPPEYSQRWLANLVQTFSFAMELLNNPGEGRNTFGVYTALQTDDYGLEEGAVFDHDGFLKVSRQYAPHVRGVSATLSLGTVTITGA